MNVTGSHDRAIHFWVAFVIDRAGAHDVAGELFGCADLAIARARDINGRGFCGEVEAVNISRSRNANADLLRAAREIHISRSSDRGIEMIDEDLCADVARSCDRRTEVLARERRLGHDLT